MPELRFQTFYDPSQLSHLFFTFFPQSADHRILDQDAACGMCAMLRRLKYLLNIRESSDIHILRVLRVFRGLTFVHFWPCPDELCD